MRSSPKISFCLTDDELQLVDDARIRVAASGVLKNRSEIIRAAIGVLRTLAQDELVAAVASIDRLVPGRKPGA